MDLARFDRLTRSFSAAAPRRGVLLGLFPALGLTAIPHFDLRAVQARKKKKKKAKLIRNAFGCVNVGGKCRGNSGNCCSSICQGEAPKKGKPDRSVCVAHNTGGCEAADDSCGAMTPAVCPGGICLRTTGNAGFCGSILETACTACQRDIECEAAFGAGAACIVCPSGSCDDTGFRYCSAAA